MDDSQRTAADALKSAMEGALSVRIRGGNWQRTASSLWADNEVDDDLGKFAGEPRTYNLTQAQRDRLLVHTRRDAAATVQYVAALSDDMHRLKETMQSISFAALLFFGLYVVHFYWTTITSALANPWWLTAFSWAVLGFWMLVLCMIALSLWRALSWRVQVAWAIRKGEISGRRQEPKV